MQVLDSPSTNRGLNTEVHGYKDKPIDQLHIQIWQLRAKNDCLKKQHWAAFFNRIENIAPHGKHLLWVQTRLNIEQVVTRGCRSDFHKENIVAVRGTGLIIKAQIRGRHRQEPLYAE